MDNPFEKKKPHEHNCIIAVDEILEISKTFTKAVIDDSLDTNVQNDLFEDDTESCEVFTNCGE